MLAFDPANAHRKAARGTAASAARLAVAIDQLRAEINPAGDVGRRNPVLVDAPVFRIRFRTGTKLAADPRRSPSPLDADWRRRIASTAASQEHRFRTM
jgi:hypothetical protein